MVFLTPSTEPGREFKPLSAPQILASQFNLNVSFFSPNETILDIQIRMALDWAAVAPDLPLGKRRPGREFRPLRVFFI